MEQIIELLPVFTAGLLAAIGWLIKSYFSAIDRRLEALAAALHRRDGRIDALLSKLDKTTEELHKVRYEVKAVWRFIDNVPKRATDLEVGNG